jgi:hypothetical protein
VEIGGGSFSQREEKSPRVKKKKRKKMTNREKEKHFFLNFKLHFPVFTLVTNNVGSLKNLELETWELGKIGLKLDTGCSNKPLESAPIQPLLHLDLMIVTLQP